MKRALPVVAVVGRPNVGKSTIFNRILGRRMAIVEDVPGVTRDRNFAVADWGGRDFYLVDTGGLEAESRAPLAAAVRTQVLAAIAEADALVVVVDGRAGPHPLDFQVAETVRRTDLPVVLAVNKMDRLPAELAHNDFWELGLGEPLPVSGISGKGSGDLLDSVVAQLPESGPEPAAEALRVAVIGKPNVGKSSLINRLLAEERLVVSDAPGTTRDSIDTPMRYHGQTLIFVDTAGLRRQARIDAAVEYYSALRTARAIERADVCLLVIDASAPVHVQDLKIAERAWRAGCGLIVVANKWDLVERETGTAEAYKRYLRERAPSLRWAPVLFTSAITGQRVQRTLDLVLEVAAERMRRIPTHEVNEAVQDLSSRQPPPHFRGRQVKLLYATQADRSPPTFVIFTNHPDGVPENYMRYLHNSFRARWGFVGAPIRIQLRARKEGR